jgi:hypothetical protein
MEKLPTRGSEMCSMWRGTKGGLRQFDVRGRFRVLAYYYSSATATGPVVTVLSALFCPVLLSNTFPVSTPVQSRTTTITQRVHRTQIPLIFLCDIGLPAREGLARATAESH